MEFKDLNIIPSILKALENENYTTPTPIQEEAIPPILAERDLLGCAQTGTGKTAAFAVPILQLLGSPSPTARNIRALILTPTRELAIQIYESFCSYGCYTGLRTCVVYGGVPQRPQEAALKKGVDILVATPGRLADLMQQKLVDLHHIQILTLDEADRMLDMGFIHDVKKIIAKTPDQKQTLFFSATMPPEIVNMSQSMLVDPVRVSITPESPTVDTIEQTVYFVDKPNKRNLLLFLLKDPSIESALVFTRTKHGADRVVRELIKGKINAQAIHGDKSQNSRQRALSDFKKKVTRVLVATDIAARGLDIDDLSHVINFDLPDVPETYIHRIGRTGRAGNSGKSISFCDEEEAKSLRSIEKLCKRGIPVVEDQPYHLPISFVMPAPPVRSGGFHNPPRRGNSSIARPGGRSGGFRR
ncbi:MAG: DEAD/DEAH box helicase [Eubacteriales bacterium]